MPLVSRKETFQARARTRTRSRLRARAYARAPSPARLSAFSAPLGDNSARLTYYLPLLSSPRKLRGPDTRESRTPGPNTRALPFISPPPSAPYIFFRILRLLETAYSADSKHCFYPRRVWAWIHIMRGLGRFELSNLMSSELAASSDVIKIGGP